MARTGRFGRLPRAAPSLSSVMVSLAREMASQQDRNMVDAWQKGGEVDGVKITDAMLIKHFTGRRDGVSKDDPLWDYYDNLVQNYQFSVDESKMTLQYADKKVGDLGMASFYEAQAAKHPADSEASRDLLRTAAAYRERARAAAAAGAARGRAASQQAAFNNVYSQYQKDWDVASGYLTYAAQLAGIIGPKEKLTDMATTAEIGREDDFTRFMGLFDDISNSKDPAMAAVRAALEAEGLGGLTFDDFTKLSDRNSEGFRKYAVLADAAGDHKAAQGYRDDATQFDTTRFFLKDTDEFARYDQIRRDFMVGWLDPSLSPYELRGLRDKYAAALNNLLGQSTSTSLHGSLNNELLALYGDASGGGPVEVGTTSMGDLQGTAEGVRKLDAEIAAVESGKGFLSPYTIMADGSREQRWSLVLPTAAADQSLGMLVASQQGGKNVMVWVPFAPIISHANTDISPTSGRAVTELKAGQGQDTQVGVTYTLPDGKAMYGIYQQDGTLQWFDHPPFVQKEGLSYGQPKVGSDGSITYNWALAGVKGPDFATTGRYVTPTGTTFDPRYIIDPDQFDPKVTVNGRYKDPLTAYYNSSPEARLALLSTSDKALADAYALAGMPEDQAAQLLTTVSGAREDLRQQANRAVATGTAGSLLGGDYGGLRGRMLSAMLQGEDLYPTGEAGLSPEMAHIREQSALLAKRQQAIDILNANGVPVQPRLAALNALTVGQIDGWLRSVQASKVAYGSQRFVPAGYHTIAGPGARAAAPYELPPLPTFTPPRAGTLSTSQTLPDGTPTPPAIRVPTIAPLPSFTIPHGAMPAAYNEPTIPTIPTAPAPTPPSSYLGPQGGSLLDYSGKVGGVMETNG